MEEYGDKEAVRLICALMVHLLMSSIDEAWMIIMEDKPNEEKVTEFANYMGNQWIGLNIPMAMWNVFNQQHRTANDVEGCHNTKVHN